MSLSTREPAPFERDHSSCRGILDFEFGQNVFDVLADRASARVENNADIVVAFALRNPEKDFGLAGRQIQRR